MQLGPNTLHAKVAKKRPFVVHTLSFPFFQFDDGPGFVLAPRTKPRSRGRVHHHATVEAGRGDGAARPAAGKREKRKRKRKRTTTLQHLGGERQGHDPRHSESCALDLGGLCKIVPVSRYNNSGRDIGHCVSKLLKKEGN